MKGQDGYDHEMTDKRSEDQRHLGEPGGDTVTTSQDIEPSDEDTADPNQAAVTIPDDIEPSEPDSASPGGGTVTMPQETEEPDR